MTLRYIRLTLTLTLTYRSWAWLKGVVDEGVLDEDAKNEGGCLVDESVSSLRSDRQMHPDLHHQQQHTTENIGELFIVKWSGNVRHVITSDVVWDPSILGQDRSQTKKVGLGLARYGLGLSVGLAGLMLCCETRSCYACRHNGPEGLSNFSSTNYSFTILCLEHH